MKYSEIEKRVTNKQFVNVKKNILATIDEKDKCDSLSSVLFRFVFTLSCPSNLNFASHQFTLNICITFTRLTP